MFHDEQIKVRVQSSIKKEAVAATISHPEKYDSLAHFVRAALIREIRAHKEGRK
jgi:hypothetical protein